MDVDSIFYPSIETAIKANIASGEDGAVRDMNALGSALAAPKNAAVYEDADLVNQCAILIQRVALNHPFVDGNKRAAFILGSTFLLLNGYQLKYSNEREEMALAYTIESMVADKAFDDLVSWIEDHIISLTEEE